MFPTGNRPSLQQQIILPLSMILFDIPGIPGCRYTLCLSIFGIILVFIHDLFDDLLMRCRPNSSQKFLIAAKEEGEGFDLVKLV